MFIKHPLSISPMGGKVKPAPAPGGSPDSIGREGGNIEPE